MVSYSDAREPVCSRCGEIKPYEAVTNRRVAALAQRPGVGAIVPVAIWLDAPSSTRAFPSRALAFADRSVGADWVLTHQDVTTARQAEHKPWPTPSQWSWATVDYYRNAFEYGVIEAGTEWPGIPSGSHEEPHSGRAWKGACWSCYSVKGTRGRQTRLTLPQVVVYCVRAGLPCTLITDRGQDASAVYGTGQFFKINPDWVPIRTIPDVLNSLASYADSMHLSRDDRGLLQDVVTRLWWHSPWEALSSLSESANELVRPSARRHWRECVLTLHAY
jgi:hypothetical protein